MNISNILINWYTKNKRDLPWRKTKDPYHIWVSEIILQQTRVNQGIEYYSNFLKKFPTVFSLANANIDEVLKLWQGLGYYSRARNMHETAKHVVHSFQGIFPDDFDELIKLKGIGEYTAAAISSFAFNKPFAVLDGNVYRVIARIFGIKKAINLSSSKHVFKKLANELLNPEKSYLHNQSIMEFGALQCIPRKPNCQTCPLNSLCYAYKENCVEKLPAKEKRRKIKSRYFNYVVINYKNYIYIHRREKQDIWKKLYDFPLIETDKETSPELFLKSKELNQLLGKEWLISLKVSDKYIHQLTHQKIYARFYYTRTVIKPSKLNKQYIQIGISDFNKYAIPKLIENYLQKELLKNILLH